MNIAAMNTTTAAWAAGIETSYLGLKHDLARGALREAKFRHSLAGSDPALEVLDADVIFADVGGQMHAFVTGEGSGAGAAVAMLSVIGATSTVKWTAGGRVEIRQVSDGRQNLQVPATCAGGFPAGWHMSGDPATPDAVRDLLAWLSGHPGEIPHLCLRRILLDVVLSGRRCCDIDLLCLIDGRPVAVEYKRKTPSRDLKFGINTGQFRALRHLVAAGIPVLHAITLYDGNTGRDCQFLGSNLTQDVLAGVAASPTALAPSKTSYHGISKQEYLPVPANTFSQLDDGLPGAWGRGLAALARGTGTRLVSRDLLLQCARREVA